jgi:hypothetical protein
MSQNVRHNFFSAPADARAALFFLEGHYQLNYREGEDGGVERTKFLSPAQIGRAFSTRRTYDSGWISANILRFAEERKTFKILSFLPAGRRKIFITDPRPPDEREIVAAKSAADPILELEIPLPTLVLLGFGQKYLLWATLDKTINENTKICAAPFPNLGKSGDVCFGGNVAPECRIDTIEAVWRLILDSPFNNHQAANRTKSHPEDARKLLLELGGKSEFPADALIKTEHTAKDLWHSVRVS